MSLEIAAKHLASKGRGPDTQLVHMTPGEVQSLQQIAMAHGGSLTINPETGLPEAGFLKNILPMIAGAGLAMIPGVGPLMAAGLVGGGTSIATGSWEKGLMAGLGAYGGAGLAGGLMGAGASSVGATANALGTPAATGAGSQAAMLAAQNQGFGQAGLQALGQSAATAPGAASIVSTPMQSITAGAKGLLEPAGRDAFMSNIGGTKGLLKSGLAAAAPMMMGQEAQAPGIKPTTPTTPFQYNANPVGPTPKPDVPGYSDLGQDFGRQRRYFNHEFTPINPPAAVAPITNMPIDFNYAGGMAAGGPVEAMSAANVYDMQNARGGVSDMGIDNSTGMQRMAGGGPISRMVEYIKAHPELAEQQNQQLDGTHVPYPQLARGGISHLGDYSDGGRLLKGPGDGVSDDIPAMIGEKQPARLADGEFVVPARIVSELGNGSTEAGARKLYAMMERVQQNRQKTVGKDRVAVNSRSDKYLPA
jgi:hypothetical protein